MIDTRPKTAQLNAALALLDYHYTGKIMARSGRTTLGVFNVFMSHPDEVAYDRSRGRLIDTNADLVCISTGYMTVRQTRDIFAARIHNEDGEETRRFYRLHDMLGRGRGAWPQSWSGIGFAWGSDLGAIDRFDPLYAAVNRSRRSVTAEPWPHAPIRAVILPTFDVQAEQHGTTYITPTEAMPFPVSDTMDVASILGMFLNRTPAIGAR